MSTWTLFLFTVIMAISATLHLISWVHHESELHKLRQAVKLAGRIPGKPFIMHQNWCSFHKTATCVCGKEPRYSIERRRARGEIE